MLAPWTARPSPLSASRGLLERNPVVWLSSIRGDGAPHLVPTWFAWDGESIVIRSKPEATKVLNLRRDPRAMLALGDADDDFDVGLGVRRCTGASSQRPRSGRAGGPQG